MPAPTTLHLSAARRPLIQKIRLDIESGPDQGRSVQSDAEPLRIGTLDACDLRLSDDTVSALHVELRRTGDGIMVHDLGSKNGTYLEQCRIQTATLEGATVLRLGRSVVRVTPLAETTAVDISEDASFGELVGSSPVMRALFAKLRTLAARDGTVLITGETGTGKELTAQAIRDLGPRRDKPFVVVDCAALPANLVESELFGHEKGAFTGAHRQQRGMFERAHGGTIFLDEIGELPLSLQPVLLGMLERGQARRVGGEAPVDVDVRVIAATNRDLATEVSRKAFRADLYYRLAVVEVTLPPLRSRREDIPLIVQHFVRQMNASLDLDKDTLARMEAYPWPGNVRELRNVVERATMLREPLSVGAARAAAPHAATVDAARPFKDLKQELIDGFEQRYVEQLLKDCNGNITAAARRAQIDRVYLYKLISRHGIEVAKR